jgi:RNA polymerase-binding transcription factor DksA
LEALPYARCCLSCQSRTERKGMRVVSH